jgi:hypothetical protein
MRTVAGMDQDWLPSSPSVPPVKKAISPNGARSPRHSSRISHASAATARWVQLDPEEHPFVHRVATRLRDHDDRAQFLAGIDLILEGVEGTTQLDDAMNRPSQR